MISGCTVLDHPLARRNVARLRDRLTDTAGFRRALRVLAQLVAIEGLRSAGVRRTEIETPLARCEGHELASPVVVVPILRAGLGMADAILELIPEASVGHVGMFRDEATFEPQSYYFKAPPLEDAEVLLVDPMLATGRSAADAATKLKGAGARKIRLLAVIGAVPGVEHFIGAHPEIPVVLAALDPELNASAYIVPGLGDAGDRYFGT